MTQLTFGGDAEELRKKLKDAEKRITKVTLYSQIKKLRNENQQLKIDYDKAVRALEKEMGEVVNVDDILKEDSQWKGRAQKIEILKAKLK